MGLFLSKRLAGILFSIVFLFALFLFTFRLLNVPPGIETDEGSIAHNAALISKTFRDQNGRFLPIFILSSDKIDWKQPVLIYLSAIYFKIFGTSLLVFKSVNVTVSLFSLVLMWLSLKLIFRKKFAVVGTIIFVCTPIIIIASRLGNEGIQPILFATMWILALALYRKNNKTIFVILAALSLGIGLYSYKGMRLIVPPWTLLTLVYIYLRNTKSKFLNKKFLIDVVIFIITLLPFFLITPFLELKYPGAVFDRRVLSLESYRHYAYYWLSNLDFGFLFSQGDIGKIFSVDLFGNFLLATIPFFLLGIKKSVERISFFSFILICYIFTPVLFGLAGSMGYGHRLVATVPLYVIITTLGVQTLFEWPKSKYKKGIILGLLLFYLFNFSDFLNYYYFKYPKLVSTKTSFDNNLDKAFYSLAQESKNKNLTPYVQDDIYYSHGEGNQFFEVAYFKQPLKIWKLGQTLPKGSILLTQVEQFEGAKNIGNTVQNLHILTSD